MAVREARFSAAAGVAATEAARTPTAMAADFMMMAWFVVKIIKATRIELDVNRGVCF